MLALEDMQTATVLIVDDEAGPRESLRMILSPHYQVLQAQTGADALEILRREDVQLVTVDLNMPGMAGCDLMRTVRSEFPRVEVIVITGCGSVETAAEGIRYGVCDYLQKPFDVVQVTSAVVRALSRQAARTRLATFLEEAGRIVGRDREARAVLHDLACSEGLRGRLGDLFELRAGGRAPNGLPPIGDGLEPGGAVEFLEVLAETIETKDRFMRGHARRVALFSTLLADRLGVPAEEQEALRIAAFLHDLGKVGVPTEMLLRGGALEAGERGLVEQHPEMGARLLAPLGVSAEVSLAIRHHHEWWDGTGYPDGLAGEEIPLAARIIGVADAFDAMSCDRPYRQALDRERVAGELRRFAGIQFDPCVVKEFLLILESGEEDVDIELLADAITQRQPARAAVA